MRVTQALIHLPRLHHNLVALRSIAPTPAICFMVKANGYGHGAVKIAQSLTQHTDLIYGVSNVDEGLALRDAGIGNRIIVYGYADHQELTTLAQHSLEPFVGDLRYCSALAQTARMLDMPLSVHVKIDTGMGRMGCTQQELLPLVTYIRDSDFLHCASIFTHLADGSNAAYTKQQITLFEVGCNLLTQRHIPIPPRHCANSAAIFNKSAPHYDMVRPGIMLYGYRSDPRDAAHPPLLPVMELQSKIVFLKRVAANSAISYGMTWVSKKATVIATVPIGYADGYSRLLSNSATVLIKCKDNSVCTASVVGRVCMDYIMLDVGHIKQIQLHDTVILFGDAERKIGADTLANMSNTIPYEIICAISARVPRIYYS